LQVISKDFIFGCCVVVEQTDILILDFGKTFDKVNYSLLIHKLHHYGIIGKSVRWIQNWLANRKQYVVIDGSTSDAVSVDL
jgi:hypothetical protein